MAEQSEEDATALAAQEREKHKDETEKGDRQIWHLRSKSSRMAFYKRVSNGSICKRTFYDRYIYLLRVFFSSL